MAYFVIVFVFVLIVSGMGMYHEERMKRMKIEAALREAEMERGYKPGTYSRSFSSKKEYKSFKKEMKKGNFNTTEKAEREELEKGIKDLEKRIENIDLIMKEREKKND